MRRPLIGATAARIPRRATGAGHGIVGTVALQAEKRVNTAPGSHAASFGGDALSELRRRLRRPKKDKGGKKGKGKDKGKGKGEKAPLAEGEEASSVVPSTRRGPRLSSPMHIRSVNAPPVSAAFRGFEEARPSTLAARACSPDERGAAQGDHRAAALRARP